MGTKVLKIFRIVFISIFLSFLPFFVFARTFNPNNIISDDLFNNLLFTKSDVQNFLDQYSGFLKTYKASTPKGVQLASEIIYNAAKKYSLSAKVLLTTLQKEQGLITASNPSDYALNWATGYHVGQNYAKGFYNQVNYCAWALGEKYDQDRGKYNYDVGKTTVTLDGYKVTPENYSTAKLFIYTPYHGGPEGIGGNYLFWDIYWNRWFGKVRSSGSLVRQEGTLGVYLIKEGRKELIISPRILDNLAKKETVVEISGNEMTGYGSSNQRVGFPEGSLIRAPWGTVYVIENGKRRGIPSREVFYNLGFRSHHIVQNVSKEEIRLHKEGEPFDPKHLTRPEGSLVKLAEEPGVYLIKGGKKRPIWHKSIIETSYRNVPIVDISKKELESFLLGPPVKHRDGTLIRGAHSGTVYLIENGKKRGFATRQVFEAMSLSFDNVEVVPDELLRIYPEGEAIRDF